jgi:O-antigen/teichoic acid export membrane protein
VPWLAADRVFEDSWSSFAILVGSIGSLAAWLSFGNLLLMANRPGWNTVLMASVVGINVLGNALLIPRFGIAGAASGTAIAFGAFALLLRLIVRRELGLRI